MTPMVTPTATPTTVPTETPSPTPMEVPETGDHDVPAMWLLLLLVSGTVLLVMLTQWKQKA